MVLRYFFVLFCSFFLIFFLFFFFLQSEQGRRPTQEDAHVFFIGPLYACFALFDGHGGPRCAEFCSQNLVRILDDCSKGKDLENATAVSQWIEQAVSQLEAEFLKLCAENDLADGSTLVLAVAVGSLLIVANVGGKMFQSVNLFG